MQQFYAQTYSKYKYITVQQDYTLSQMEILSEKIFVLA